MQRKEFHLGDIVRMKKSIPVAVTIGRLLVWELI
jgi:hypothetical protein